MIDQDFTLYPEALELKQLGFDEPCISVRHRDGTLLFITHQMTSDEQSEHLPTIKNSDCMWENDDEYSYGGIQEVATPTYSQAFRWFREKHKLNGETPYLPNIEKYGVITADMAIKPKGLSKNENLKRGVKVTNNFQKCDTHEEAELACLKKLIKIANEKRN